MADEGLQIGLAVSLHAPNDELRTQLVPVNKGYPVDEVLAAVRRYIAKTNRRVTFEYALMAGINDTPALGAGTGGEASGHSLSRQLDPAQPDPRQQVSAYQRCRRRALCTNSARRQHPNHRAPAPRHRDQRRLWTVAAEQ
jgi:23S rRNA (adenine2503-C2)-methyltransferase